MEKSIEKDNTEILKLLKSKNQALNLKSITSKDPGVETNKDNNELYHTSDNNAKFIARNPTSVKRFMHIN